jgi:hypothetical protein
MMPEKTRTKITRTVRQDLSFLVGVLLLLTVILAALSGLSSDEAEFFGLGDDLHVLAGWGLVVLTVLHTVLCWSQMMNYAKRRFRNRFGVGGVMQTGSECGQEQDPATSGRGEQSKETTKEERTEQWIARCAERD